MRIIDAHCHLGNGCSYSLAADDLLRLMDTNHVAVAVVVPVDRCIAVYNQEGNNEVLAATGAHPDRFIPFASVNPWYGKNAVEELERCFEQGAAGLKLHPVIQGFSIVDEIAFPVIELAIEHRKPVYFHTGTPVHSTPFQLTELAMRYPEGRFIMGHAAYADYWNDVAYAVGCVTNVYVETSLHLAGFIRTLSEQLGARRLIFGSDSPKAVMSLEIEKISKYVASKENREAIFADNMERLLQGAV